MNGFDDFDADITAEEVYGDVADYTFIIN